MDHSVLNIKSEMEIKEEALDIEFQLSNDLILVYPEILGIKDDPENAEDESKEMEVDPLGNLYNSVSDVQKINSMEESLNCFSEESSKENLNNEKQKAQVRHEKEINNLEFTAQIIEKENTKEGKVASPNENVKKTKCFICNLNFNSTCLLKNHLTTHLDEGLSIFKCNECDYSCNKKTSLEVHKIEHKRLFKCLECNFESTSIKNLKMHKLKHNDSIRCEKCSYSCSKKISMKAHKLVHKNTFKCSECDFESNSLRNLKKHRTLTHINSLKYLENGFECSKRKDKLIHKISSDLRRFHCSECNFQSDYIKKLKDHVALIHTTYTNSQICSLCDFECKEEVDLNDHMLIHTKLPKSKRFKCSECNFESNYKKPVKKHHILMHTNIKWSECSQTCSESNVKCDEGSIFKNFNLIDKISPNLKKFQCLECNFKGSSKKTLKKHQMIMHSISTGILVCSLCDYECSEESNLNNHMLEHTSSTISKRFKCSECSFESSFVKTIKKHHMLTHASILECYECDYKCREKNSFVNHMYVHKKQKYFKCSECNFMSNSEKYYKKHTLAHTYLNLLKCTKCPYRGKDRRDFKIHMLKHRGIKFFKCSDCNFESIRKHSLKSHILRHCSDTKLFNCPKCDYTCDQRSTLNKHIIKHSYDKLFQCSDCKKECSNKSVMNMHSIDNCCSGKCNVLFRCLQCSFKCNYTECVRNHISTHGSNTTNDFDHKCSCDNNDFKNFDIFTTQDV